MQTVTFTWGVKQSFRGYVERMGGVIETLGGAERSADGGFAFAPAPDSSLTMNEDGAPQGRGAFQGEVTFKAHGGMLSVFLADPILEFSDGSAVLSVADSAARDRRVDIAKLDLTAMSRGDDGFVIPTSLTIDGSFLLGDHYPPRTALDPVVLKIASA